MTLSGRKILPRCGRLIAIVGLMPAIIALGGLAGLRVNLTPSEPLGLWRISPLDRPAGVGDLVFICPPDTGVLRQARDRGYLRSGLCPSGYAPLIKTVVAVSGQVIVIGHNVSIDGAELSHSALVTRDAQGRALVPFVGGTVPANNVFLHSDFPGSFDSRYFGPVPVSGILGLARKVLTYAP